MITARIEIQKVLFKLPYLRKRRIKIPTSWAELKRRHYPALAEWYFGAARAERFDLLEAGLLFCEWAKLPAEYATAPEIQAHPVLTKNAAGFIKLIKHPEQIQKRLLLLPGPGNKLTHLNYAAFLYAEACLENWINTEQKKYLRGLAAVSYGFGFVSWIASSRAALFKLLPKSLLIKAAFNYIGQRNHLPEMYPELYQNQPQNAPRLKIDQRILAMCGAELGGYQNVKKAPLHRVLELMQLKEQQYIKINPKHGQRNRTVENLRKRASADTRRHNAQRK